MLNIISNFFTRKPSFVVDGIEFNTKQVEDGVSALAKDQAQMMRDYGIIHYRMPKFEAPWAIPSKHVDLPMRFQQLQQLMRSSGLSSNVHLGLTMYGTPHMSVVTIKGDNSKVLLVDHADLKLLTPEEIEGSMAHELAHIKSGHFDVNSSMPLRAQEFQADRGTAEIGKAKGFISSLKKLRAFEERLADASPAMRCDVAIKNATSRCGRVLNLLGYKFHPSDAERIVKLEAYIAQSHIRIP